MNTKIIGLVVGALIVGGGAYWYVNNNAATSSTGKETTPEVLETSDLLALVKTGGNYECAVSMTTPQATSKGTVFVSGTNVRGDFTSSVGGQTVTSSMIQTGGYVYTWSSMVPQGFKFKSTVDANPLAALGSMQMPEGGSYTCTKWSGDTSKFVPPTTVKFVEAPAAAF